MHIAIRSVLRSIALVIVLAAGPAVARDGTPGTRVFQTILPCKNHYILEEPCGLPGYWVLTGELRAGRLGHTATLLADGRVLVAGGTNDATKSAELYDPRTGLWTLTAPLTYNRSTNAAISQHTATLLPNGKVLVAGSDFSWGTSAQALDSTNGTAELFDPATQTWTLARGMNVAREGFTATLLGTGKVLVVGGVDGRDQSLASAELYDPETGSWEMTGSLSVARFWHTATLLRNGRVLVVGGWLDDEWQLQTAVAEIYDPVSGSWELAGRTYDERTGHTATILDDGSVLVSGGFFKSVGSDGWYHQTTLGTAERFDPATLLWERVDDLAMPRYDHTATVLPGGRVLVAGGTSGGGTAPGMTFGTLASSELSDGAAWLPANALNVARSGHTATLLVDGSVLVAGGGWSTAEIYKPAVAKSGEPR